MMYFFKKLDDGAEVNYSEASDEGNVKIGRLSSYDSVSAAL